MTAKDIVIREMQRKDLEALLALINAEGWNYDMAEMVRIHEVTPGASVVACSGGEVIGGITAADSGGRAVLAHVIIKDGWRNKGIGTRMIDDVMARMRAKGVALTEAYSVKNAVAFYRRHGFHYVEDVHTYSKTIGKEYRDPKPADGRIRTLGETDLPNMVALDRRLTGLDRGRYIERFFKEFPGMAKGMFEGGRLVGYIQGRTNPTMNDVGPWAMEAPDKEGMRAMLLSILSVLPAGKYSIVGMPGKNSAEVDLLKEQGFKLEPVQHRMVKTDGKLEPFTENYLALSAFEFG